MRARTKVRVHGRRARNGKTGTSSPNHSLMLCVPIATGRAVFALAVLIAAICACDVHHNEPIAECIEYASKVRACFGERAGDHLLASYAKPPAEERARAALMARCASGTAMVARSCR